MTRVGGVPVYTVEAPGPRRAVLAFRVGRADETLAWAGLTHLVEHLALVSFKEQPYAYGGQVEGARTLFYVQGSDAEIREFFNRLCENLRALPLDRLADEARLLETEAQSRQGGALSSLLGGRYGCQGWGLMGYPEYALQHPEPDRVKAWADEWFTAENAALGLSGPMDPPPIDLRSGRRMASPALTPLSLVRTPAWFHDREQGVAMSFIAPYSVRFSSLMRVLQRHGFSRLRFGESLSYEVDSATLRLGRDNTHGIMWADGLPENVSKVLNGMLSVLDEVMEKGPTEAELREDVEALRKSIDNPGWPMALLDGQLTNDLFGTTMRTSDEAIAELESATPRDYAALLREIFPSLLTIVPSGVAVLDRRLTAVPAWSTDEAHGTVYRLRAATSVVAQQMTSLTVGDAAIGTREAGHDPLRRVHGSAYLGRWQPDAALARQFPAACQAERLEGRRRDREGPRAASACGGHGSRGAAAQPGPRGLERGAATGEVGCETVAADRVDAGGRDPGDRAGHDHDLPDRQGDNGRALAPARRSSGSRYCPGLRSGALRETCDR